METIGLAVIFIIVTLVSGFLVGVFFVRRGERNTSAYIKKHYEKNK